MHDTKERGVDGLGSAAYHGTTMGYPRLPWYYHGLPRHTMGLARRVDEHTCPFTTSPNARCAPEFAVHQNGLGGKHCELWQLFHNTWLPGSSKNSSMVKWWKQLLCKYWEEDVTLPTLQGCIQILRVWIGLVLKICYRIGTSSLLSGLWSSTTNYTTWHTVTIVTLLWMMSASLLMRCWCWCWCL